MIYLLIMFFFLLYILLEFLKYERVNSIKKKLPYNKRLYNKPVLYIKIVVAFIDILLVIINHAINIVESSGGLMPVITTVLVMGVIMLLPSALEIRRVRNGYNEKLTELM